MLILLLVAGVWSPDSGMKVTSFCSKGLIVTVMRGKVGMSPVWLTEHEDVSPVWFTGQVGVSLG